MSSRALIDECKAHFLHYQELILAGDSLSVKDKLNNDAQLDPTDSTRTLSLQRSAMIMTENYEPVKEEYNRLYTVHLSIIQNILESKERKND